MEFAYESNQIGEAAKRFLHSTANFRIYAFSGDLGAGKTTFISALCRQMGVTEAVSSPSYPIIQEYWGAGNKPIYHIDLYRIKSLEEAMDAGIEDCLTSEGICMVEWPERLPEIFPDDTIFTTLVILSPNQRKLIIQLPR